MFRGAFVLSEHLAEELPLLDRIIKGDMRVPAWGKPPPRHIPLRGFTIARS